LIGLKCKWCGQMIREHTKMVYIPAYKRKKGDANYEEKIIGETYMMTYCRNTDHFQKYKNRIKELRADFTKIRNKMVSERPKCLIPYCKRKTYCVHHITPICDGGTNEKTNLAPLCKFHHHMIHHQGITIDGNYRYFNPKDREGLWKMLNYYQENHILPMQLISSIVNAFPFSLAVLINVFFLQYFYCFF